MTEPTSAPLPERLEEQAERMESFAQAYPEAFFPPLTPEQRAHAGDSIITRASAEMGRHFSRFATAAAHALREAAAALDKCERHARGQVTVTAEIQRELHEAKAAIAQRDDAASLRAECDALRAELRRIAIFHAGFIGGSFNGEAFGCRLCNIGYWRSGEREKHRPACLAAPVERTGERT